MRKRKLKWKKENKRENDEGGSSTLKRRMVSMKPKGAMASSGHVFSPTPLRIVAPINQIALNDTGHDEGEPNALGNINRSTSPSSHGSTSESVHNFTNVEDIGAQESPYRMKPFAENSTSAPASRLRQVLTGRNIEEERFENLLADYDTIANTHVECSKTVQKLVTAHEDLEHNAKLYTDAINRYRAVKEEHAGCGQKVQILKNEENYLSAVSHDKAARIQSLEAKLARKDSSLTYAERMLAEGDKDREKLAAQLGQAEIENFDCIQKFLPIVVKMNGVSPLLVLIDVRLRASFLSSGHTPSFRQRMIGVIQLSPSSFTMMLISFPSVDRSFKTSTKTSLLSG
nr:hypothetical protein [Tanacetum cinerariifolium]